MRDARQFPSFKKFLFKIHNDLDTVVRNSDWWIGQDDLSDLEVLVLLLEDRRFLQHRGVDWRSIVRELVRTFTFRRHGGASTIDMQFVRTKTGFKERTLKRKFYEMLLAYLLQFRMGKLEIFRSYLSVVYLGHGVRGIAEAAEVAYGKSLWDLSRRECAEIAAMMVYPRPTTPGAAWQGKISKRADYGLKLFDRFGRRYKQGSE